LRLLPLILIEVTAFLLIIAESYAFFEFVVIFGPIPHSLSDYTVDAVARLVLTVGLGVLWFVVMVGLTRLYVRSKLGNPTPTTSS
jgi:hypothetical protein